MSQSITFKQAAILVLFLAVAQFLLQVGLLVRGVEYAATSLVIDDTYYYLQTAWNTKLLGFVTFDGIHPTNGVQFLWFVVILLLAMLAKTKTVLLFATMVVGFLLNGLCYFFILKIGAILKQPTLALFMAGLWLLQCLPFRIYSTGMENSLHALVFWCVIWQGVEFLIRTQNNDEPDFWRLTVVLILLVWTRLDSALISAVLFTFCVGMLAYTYRHNLKIFLQSYIKIIAGSSFLAGFGLIVQLSAFRLMGGSFLPVSALVKTSGAGRGLSIEAVDKFVEVFLLGLPSILQGRFPTFVLILMGVSGILLVMRAQITNANHPKELMVFLNLWLCLLFGEILYHIYIAISGVQYVLYFAWYRSPSFIFWIITASLITFFALEQLQRVRPSWTGLKWVPFGVSLLSITVAAYLFARSINFTSKLYVARYSAALWIAENSPPDAVFAAWNAGQLSFFSNRAFINLDGVINNVDYYERVLRGSISLADYLFENNVDYLVDYATYASIPDYSIIRTFPLKDDSGRSIQIWQVSPRASSAP